jgi:hypothetical protein
MLVLVCGSRVWTSEGIIRARLRELPRGTTIIHGGARGADLIAATVARSLGFQTVEYRADWKNQGRGAGFARNLRMLDAGPDLVLAFWDGRSRGTLHTVRNAERRYGIPVEVIRS